MSGGKKAVLIGCNYPGTDSQLNGCVNDVWNMYNCLVNTYGFAEEDITVLIDTDDSYRQPTGANIRSALTDLVESAEPGDCLFVHYSGHGTRVPAEGDDDDATGYDECIVPCDMNLITDDDFRKLVHKVPEGCRITVVSDSCHSGGLIEQVKEQIGESNEGEEHAQFEEEEDSSDGDQRVKSRSLPLSKFINILKERSGRDDVDVGQLRVTLFDQFGDDASAKVKRFVSKLMEEEFEEETDDSEEGFRDRGILISGCQTFQTSADLTPSGDPTESYGALSNAIHTVINEYGNVSNMDLVIRVREILEGQEMTQKPGLYCSDDHADSPFICSMDE